MKMIVLAQKGELSATSFHIVFELEWKVFNLLIYSCDLPVEQKHTLFENMNDNQAGSWLYRQNHTWFLHMCAY